MRTTLHMLLLTLMLVMASRLTLNAQFTSIKCHHFEKVTKQDCKTCDIPDGKTEIIKGFHLKIGRQITEIRAPIKRIYYDRRYAYFETYENDQVTQIDARNTLFRTGQEIAEKITECVDYEAIIDSLATQSALVDSVQNLKSLINQSTSLSEVDSLLNTKGYAIDSIINDSLIVLRNLIDSKSDTSHTHLKIHITDFSEDDYATGSEGDLATTSVQPSLLADTAQAIRNDFPIDTKWSPGQIDSILAANGYYPVDTKWTPPQIDSILTANGFYTNDTKWSASQLDSIISVLIPAMDRDTTNDLTVEIDPVWISQKPGYYDTTQVDSIFDLDLDRDSTNEIQSLSIDGYQVGISGDTSITLPDSIHPSPNVSISPPIPGYVADDVYEQLLAMDVVIDSIIAQTLAGITIDAMLEVDSQRFRLIIQPQQDTFYIDVTDMDSTISEAWIDAMVANNGYLTVEVDGSITNEIQALSISNDTVFLANGGFVKLPGEGDGSVTNEIQAISISNDTIFLSGDGFVKLPVDQINDADSDSNNELQNLTNDGKVSNVQSIGISNGTGISFSVADADSLTTNEIQALSISNDTIFLVNGGFAKLPPDDSGTDDQKIDTFLISGDTLFASLEADGESGKFVLLAPYLDNTDTQLSQEQVEDFAGAMVTGNTETLITVTYQDGDGTTDFAVDANLSNYTNDAGFLTSETDDQKIDTFLISGDTLFASLEADGESGKFVLLAPYLDNTDTQLSQEQVEDFAGAMVTGNTKTLITVTYQDGDGTTDFAVDANLSNYTNDAGFLTSETDDQKIDTFLISGDTLFASLETDGEPGKFVLLAPYLDNTDTQLTQKQVEDFAGALVANATGTHTGIAVTYQDATGDMDLIIDHDAATNFLAGEHILHSGVTITAGDALSGGGDISATRTLDLDPSEMGAQAPDLADILPYEDVTDAGIHSMTLTQLQTTIDTDTQLSQEQVEDFAGAMVTGNTETLITVTYQDGDGTTDFAVEPNLSNYTNDAGFLTSETDDQKIDTFLISGDTLFASLEADGEPGKFVLLAPYLDNTDTQLTQEQVEDFAGAMVANGTGTHTGIAVTYQDATGHMDLIIDHDAATNFVAGEHILHSGVTITAGDALSGGGDISATRALDLDPSEMPGQAPAAADILVYEDVTDAGIHSMTITQLESIIDHGNLVGLGDDDHTIYPLLLGRATGQTLIGGTASGDDLTLESTSNATKGNVFIKSPELQSGAGLELLKFTGTASAVNEFTITNSITANDPILSATGGDANIGITLTPKGTGNIKLGTATWNADQALGSGQDEYPAVFDNGTGLVAYKQLNTAGIANDATTYDKIQNVVADQRLLGNIAGAGGIVAELTPEQVRVMLGLDEKDVSIQAWGDKTVVTIDSSLVVWKVGPEHDNVTIRELSWFSNSFGTSVDIQLVKNGTAVTLDGDNTYQISTADSTFNMTNLALTDGDRLQFKCTAVVGATTGLTFTLEGDYDAP